MPPSDSAPVDAPSVGSSLALGGGRLRIGQGLRSKAALLMIAMVALAVAVSLLMGNLLVEEMRQDLGTALARDRARITQQRILAKVGQELALSQRLAESEAFTEWLADEENAAKREKAWREVERFRRAFSDANWFSASAASQHFFFSDNKTPTPKMAYTIQAGNPENAWYFNTLKQADGRTINVDFDKHVGATKVWINVVARNAAGEPVGVVGTGLELTRFLADLLGSGDKDATTMIVDRQGAIVAHPDTSRMEFDLAQKENAHKTLYRMLSIEDGERVRELLANAAKDAEKVAALPLRLDGQPRLVALAGTPSLGWTVVTAVDQGSSTILTPRRLLAIAAAGVLLLSLLVAALTIGLDRLALAPLAQLTQSVRRIAGGHYDVRLHSERADELGELTRAFDTMAQQVRAYSEEMEQRVEERTEALAQAHRRLTDSIQYARLIQNTILPGPLLTADMAERHFVLWQPRDVVGGDFHYYRSGPDGPILGVVDCAGHGVPGACMTMATHPAVAAAVDAASWRDPAAILTRLDAALRANLSGDPRIVASVDAGFCHYSVTEAQLYFAGAHMSLFWSDGRLCEEIPGHRRSLNERKPGQFATVLLPAPPERVFYLVSDGLLDQSGGQEGHAYGARRFKAWIIKHVHLPLEAQREALTQEIQAYQGDRPRRDDLTVLAFRFGPTRSQGEN